MAERSRVLNSQCAQYHFLRPRQMLVCQDLLTDPFSAFSNELWFWDALGDIHDQAKAMIAEQLGRLQK
jgi:hypothetical protein